jgi:phosphatidylinositol alpha 1,6-mannosyltransferase
VAPEDGAALAAAVAALAGDGSRRAAMGQAARQKVLGRTWSALTDELVGHYEAAIDSAERTASATLAA